MIYDAHVFYKDGRIDIFELSDYQRDEFMSSVQKGLVYQDKKTDITCWLPLAVIQKIIIRPKESQRCQSESYK